MAEDLTPEDVQNYTGGRLSKDDPETQRALDAALSRIRLFCGWHVSPVQTETVYLDVPRSSVLFLPTLKIVSLNEIKVNGTTIDLSEIQYSREAPGALVYKDGRLWGDGSTVGYGEIEVDFSHGFTAAEAAAFRNAVLELIDQATLNIGTGGSGPLMEKKVDDVSLRWSGMVDRGFGIAKNPLNESVLYQYRLLPLT